MIFGWSKDELLKLRRKYKILLVKEPLEFINNIQTLASIDSVLRYYPEIKDAEEPKAPTERKILIEDLDFIEDYKDYLNYIIQFATYGEMVDDAELHCKPTSSTPHEIMADVTDFYDSIGGVYREKYHELIRGNRLRIKFDSVERRLTGQTMPIRNTNLIYMYVSRYFNFHDQVTATHECGHGISYLMKKESIYGNDRFLFTELTPLFFEIIADEEMAPKIGLENDGTIGKIYEYNEYLFLARMVKAKLDMIFTLSLDDLKSNEKMYSFLGNYHLDVEAIKELMLEGIEDYSVYIISYLTAIELYCIYLRDKDKALHILELLTIKDLSTPSEYLAYIKSLGIEIGKNFKGYEQLLREEKKEIKKNI